MIERPYEGEGSSVEGEELTKQGEGWREELSGVGQTYRKE